MDLKGVELTWLGHAAVRLRLGDGTTILIDPWLEGNPACPEDQYTQEKVDAIYLTHGHFDHVGSTVELAKASGAPVFSIHEISLYLGSKGVENVVGSNKGGMVEGPGGIRAFLTDAVHSSGISGDDGVVPGGEAGGWILDIPDGPTFYHAGDTTVFGDMALIEDIWSPDIAFLPIGGHFTMGPRLAATAGKMLGVETVVPIHYGTFPILKGRPEDVTEAASGAFEVVGMEPGQTIS
jgi:L-ascorbate metabolism protein UlaG (beta-lactamase superfamily)